MSPSLTTHRMAEEFRRWGRQVVEGPDVPITGGAADSRLASAGDLFGAFCGERADGNDYVSAALEAGAVAAVCERGPGRVPAACTVAITPNVTEGLQDLARWWRRECGPTVVGITGTVGKTTAKDLTAAALAHFGRTHSSPGNLNSREGLPLALMSLQTDHTVSVLEMAMDSVGEIRELCGVAEPEVGVVLNIGLTHVSRLGSIEAIEAEKLSLPRWLPASGTAVLNADDSRVAGVAGQLECRVLTFGASEGASLQRGPITDHGLEGTEFDVTFEGRSAPMRSPLPGEHVVPGALAAVGICLALGHSLEETARAITGAEVGGRLHVIRTPSGVTILDDRYNASPASMAGALRLLWSLPGRHVALVGTMAELGEFEEREHRAMGRVAAECCDALYAVGEPCRVMVEEAQAAGLADAHWFESKDEAARAVARFLRAGDVVLVKASRSQEFEAIIPVLEAAG